MVRFLPWVFALFASFSTSSVQSQAVFTHLTDPAQIKTFTSISESLICGCGCHLVLSTCPHVDCPWGIPMRRFIESRIKLGMNKDQILNGIVSGFGPNIKSDPLVRQFASEGRTEIVEKLETGFGPGVIAKGSATPSIIALVISTLILASLIIWFRKRRSGKTSGQESSKNTTAKASGERDDLLDRTRDLDQ